MKWRKMGRVFCPDGSLGWSVGYAQVPVPVYLEKDGIVRVFFSTRNSVGQSLPGCVDLDANNLFNVLKIYEKPILDLGGAGTFDDCGVMPSWMTVVDGKYYLYYIGWNVRNTIPYHNSVGLAVSDNCIDFEKMYEGPLWDRGLTEKFFSGTSCVLQDGEIYKNWYLSCTEWIPYEGRLEPRYHLKYAESQDGIHWNIDGRVAIDYYDFNEGGIVKASVIKDGVGDYKMWYATRKRIDYRKNKSNSYRIGFAKSSDGVNWTRMDDSVEGLQPSYEGWDSEMMCYPHVIDIKGERYMFYNGNCFGQTGFGLAKLERS